MLSTNITRVIEQVSRDKGISRDVLVDTIEEALRSAARKKYGSKVDIEVKFNDETGEIEVFQFMEVVEKVTDPEIEIDLEQGRKLDGDCEIGDSLGSRIDTLTFGRIAAQSAKQVIIQKMKDAEKDVIYNQFKNQKNEIINGIVQRFSKGDIIVNLGPTEAVLPKTEQVYGEAYRRGDRVRACVIDVLQHSRGPQVILSRTHPNFLINLLKTEVPEISEGLVDIKGAVREPGVRAKIAVSSLDSDIDSVGACVGMKGARVQNVVQELKGEKIDIIPWHIDPAKFVCHALAPAEIVRVIIDERRNSMEVVVPDGSLSIAIGRSGQNVRLASKLTGWRLDVISETKYSEDMKKGYESLTRLSGVGISMADALYENGFYSLKALGDAAPEDLIEIRGISEEKAYELIAAAKELEKTGVETWKNASEEQKKEDEAGAGEIDEAGVDELEPDEVDDEAELDETDVDEADADEIDDEAEIDETDAGEADADEIDDEAEIDETDAGEADADKIDDEADVDDDTSVNNKRADDGLNQND